MIDLRAAQQAYKIENRLFRTAKLLYMSGSNYCTNKQTNSMLMVRYTQASLSFLVFPVFACLLTTMEYSFGT